MVELKPCPFCGDTYIGLYRKDKYYVGCQSLGCVCLHTASKGFDTEDRAIKAWNRRAERRTDEHDDIFE